MQTNPNIPVKEGEPISSSPDKGKKGSPQNSNGKPSDEPQRAQKGDNGNENGDGDNKARVSIPSLRGPFVSKSEFVSHQVT